MNEIGLTLLSRARILTGIRGWTPHPETTTRILSRIRASRPYRPGRRYRR
ncbi:hypothetical protein OIE66_03665 [Nonomuraea sp. NBC_01738]|nr:hypothetical protein OIE66_03665 [Nonomuraea sp. NBC_01738]